MGCDVAGRGQADGLGPGKTGGVGFCGALHSDCHGGSVPGRFLCPNEQSHAAGAGNGGFHDGASVANAGTEHGVRPDAVLGFSESI